VIFSKDPAYNLPPSTSAICAGKFTYALPSCRPIYSEYWVTFKASLHCDDDRSKLVHFE